MNVNPKNAMRAQHRLEAALAALERAELRLVRAQTRWRAARATVRRLERDRDREFAVAAGPPDCIHGIPSDAVQPCEECSRDVGHIGLQHP